MNTAANTTTDAPLDAHPMTNLERLAIMLSVREQGVTWETVTEPTGTYAVVGAYEGRQIVIEQSASGETWQARQSGHDDVIAEGATLEEAALMCACEVGYQYAIGVA